MLPLSCPSPASPWPEVSAPPLMPQAADLADFTTPLANGSSSSTLPPVLTRVPGPFPVGNVRGQVSEEGAVKERELENGLVLRYQTAGQP